MSTPRNFICNSNAEFDGAFIGIAFGGTVVYNILEMHGNFELAGLSIVERLRRNPAQFVADIVASSVHGPIEDLTDHRIIQGSECNTQLNTCSYGDAVKLMFDIDAIDNYYVYDVSTDMLTVKTLQLDNPVILDYTVEGDVVRFLEHIDRLNACAPEEPVC